MDARPVHHSGVAVGFLLSADDASVARFVERAHRHGFEPVLIRSGYEVEIPPVMAGVCVRQPIDYLDSSASDRIHAEVLDWLKALPSTRLASGQRLADWTARKGFAPPVWAWLSALAPYVQVSLKSIRLARAVALAEQPSAWQFIGGGDDLDWQAPLMAQVMTDAIPGLTFWGGKPATPPAGQITHLPYWETLVPLWVLRRTKTYRAALSALSGVMHAGNESHAFEGHAVLISRGLRGTHWLTEPGSTPRLIDDYSEGYPDALADVCAERNWRLTLVWEGARPTVNGQGYTDWRPTNLFELATTSFGGIASRLRRTAYATYARALPKLFNQSTLRQAFEFDGVDTWSPNAGHFLPMLTNLSVLSATQQEGWTKAFEALRPDIVIGGRLETRPWINAAAATAKAKTASVKLGVGDEMALSMMAFRPDGEFEKHSSPDALMVWGKHQQALVEQRLPPGSTTVVAVGRARNDTFARSREVIHLPTVRQNLGLRDQGPVIVWGGTCRSRWGLWPGQRLGSAVMSPENWVAALEALVAVARQRGGQVLVKPHPADDQNFVAAQVARLGEDCVLAAATGGEHNRSLLAASDLFVSSVSSMFAEALLAGCPSVNIWTPEIGLIYEAERFELYSLIATPARSVNEMAGAAAMLLDDQEFRKAELARATESLPNLFGGCDGDNARRAASWALDFAQGRG